MGDITLRPQNSSLATPGMPAGPIAPYIPMPQPADGFTLDIRGLLIRRIWLILLVFIVGMLIAAGITYYIQNNHPRFTAVARIAITYTGPADIASLPSPILPFTNEMVKYQIDLLNSPSLHETVVKMPAIVDTRWYREDALADPKVLPAEVLRSGLRATQQSEGSRFIIASFTTRHQRDAALILNAMVNEHLVRNRAFESRGYVETINELAAQAAKLDENARLKFRDLQNFLETNRMLQAEEDDPEVYARFNVIGQLMLQEEIEYERALRNYQRSLAQDPTQIMFDRRTDLEIEASERITLLRSRLDNLQFQRDALRGKFGPRHEQMLELEAAIENQRQTIEREENRLRRAIADQRTANDLDAFQAAQTEYQQALNHYTRIEAEVRDFDSKRYRLNQLKLEANAAQEVADRLNSDLARLRLNSNDRKLNRVDLESPAAEPTTFSYPNWLTNMLLGAGLSLFVGLGLAFLLEYINRNIRSQTDIASAGFDLLGLVPHTDDEAVDIPEPLIATATAPDSLMAEQMRQVRASVRSRVRDMKIRSFMVTSPEPQEGKTCVAINLAISTAQMGARVLLIEGNMRQPCFARVLSQSKAMGLADYLSGRITDAAEIISPTAVENLYTMTAGSPAANPGELLESGGLGRLMDAVADYDFVIIDAPAGTVVSDAFSIADHVDGVILVARSGWTTKQDLASFRQQVLQHNRKIMGVVLNGVRTGRGDRLRKTARQFYSYRQDTPRLPGA